MLGPELAHARLADQIRGHARATNSELILDWLEKSDIAFLNSETVLAKSKPHYPPRTTYFAIRSDPSQAEDWKLLGINIVSVGNNIVVAYGDEELIETIEAYDRVGIKHVGGGMNLNEALTPAIFEVKGEKIGFLGFATAFGKAAAPDRAGVAAIRQKIIYEFESARLPTNYLPFYTPLPTIKQVPVEEDVQMMQDCIKDLKKKVDFVVVSIHGNPHIPPMRDWWPELKFQGFDPTPTDSQRALYHTIIDIGADLVIGHGPHSAQGIEIYKDKYIFYSLGDFFMQIEADIARNEMFMQLTLMIKIDIEKKKVSRVEILPTRIDETGLPMLSEDYENAVKVLDKVSSPLNVRLVPYKKGAIVEPAKL
jgi:poly-gamma-glutamate synthesis protein (capsule biosynthesis protein)